MLDRILATITLLCLIGFVSVVTVFVNEPDLWIIVVGVLIMASYDFFKTIRQSEKNNRNNSKS